MREQCRAEQSRAEQTRGALPPLDPPCFCSMGFVAIFCCSVLLQCKWQQVAPGCEALDIAKTAGGSARTKDIAQHQARRPHVAILHAAESVQVVGLVKAAFQFTAGLRLQKLTLDRIEILSPETSPA